MGKENEKAAAEAKKYLLDNRSTVLRMHEHPREIRNIIDHIKRYVENGCKVLTTHQLRNIFSEVKKAKTVIDFQLIRPNLAYIAARQDKEAQGAREVVEFFDEMIQGITDEKDLKGGYEFFEAIVAYHKLYAPK